MASSVLPTLGASAVAESGYDQADAQNAIAAYTGLDVASQNEVLAAADTVASQGVTLPSMTAVLSTAISLAGFPAVGAVFAAGIPLVEGLFSLLNGDGMQNCDWHIGDQCMKGVPPYGPSDPRWDTFEVWYPLEAVNWPTQDGGPESFFPGLNSIKLPSDWPTPTAPEDVFVAVYRAAWRKNAELVINGHQWVDPYTLLQTVAIAWNKTHAATSTHTFTGTNGTTYVNYLLNGVYSGQGNPAVDPGDHPPLTINTGAVTPPPPPEVQTVNLSLQKQTQAQAVTELPVQAAILMAVNGTPYTGSAQGGPAMTAAWNNLLAYGISQAQFSALTPTIQGFVNAAGIPVGSDVSAPIPTAALGAVSAAAAAPTSGTAVLLALAAAAAAGGLLWWKGKKGGALTP